MGRRVRGVRSGGSRAWARSRPITLGRPPPRRTFGGCSARCSFGWAASVRRRVWPDVSARANSSDDTVQPDLQPRRGAVVADPDVAMIGNALLEHRLERQLALHPGAERVEVVSF